MNCEWKTNWDETKQRFMDWWNHEGFFLGMWGALPLDVPHIELPKPPEPSSKTEAYTNAQLRAQREHYRLANSAFPAGLLAVAHTDLGPGSLCLHLGSEPDFEHSETVWFEPCLDKLEYLEDAPPLVFNGDDPWTKLTLDTMVAEKALAEDRYFVGIPDLCSGLDILAAMRTPNLLMMDLIEDPDTVHRCLKEIDQSYLDLNESIHAVIGSEDGTLSRSFYAWSPGRVAKLQVDVAPMISEAMFREFAQPYLAKICESFDHVIYHLDGSNAIHTLDALLEIEGLSAIEYTPEAGIEGGADPRWHAMYKKILDAGKSVQIVYLSPEEVVPLTRAIGTNGVYVMPSFTSVEQVEAVQRELGL
jgi:hypothetical protein